MNKKTIIGILIAILVIGAGVGAYFAFSSDDESSSEQTANTSQTESEASIPDLASFNPLSTTGEAFTATMTGTATDKTYTATIESDGAGNAHYTGQYDGESYDMYLLGEKNIFCKDDNCFETANISDISPIDKDQFEISSEDLTKYQEGATYQGKQDCPAGSCDVWQISVDNYTGTLYVAEDGRISKATGQSDGGTFELVYTYGDVTITPPENVQTINIPNL